jgi:hypothetical protein
MSLEFTPQEEKSGHCFFTKTLFLSGGIQTYNHRILSEVFYHCTAWRQLTLIPYLEENF